ncbi:potassium channel protein [bacterium]|nr:potassium channel protein [bacterium]
MLNKRRSDRVPFNKLTHVMLLTAGFVVLSTFIYYFIGGGEWSLFDCFYMTMISITTVGYGEIFEMSTGARLFSILVIVWGYGLLVYFVSILSELFVTGQFRRYIRLRRRKKKMKEIKNHYILCGYGEMGKHVAKEILTTYHPLVIIDIRPNIMDIVAADLGEKVPVISGDASDEETLKEAYIDKAAGMILALPQDKDNLFVLVTARALNGNIRVATKCVLEKNATKLYKAGAWKVISPAAIGGMRLASEVLRPTVTTFLDIMLRDQEKNLRIDEIDVTKDMDCVNKSLEESDFRNKTRVLIMAVAFSDGRFEYNPSATLVLPLGSKLIVLGEAKDIAKFKNLI